MASCRLYAARLHAGCSIGWISVRAGSGMCACCAVCRSMGGSQQCMQAVQRMLCEAVQLALVFWQAVQLLLSCGGTAVICVHYLLAAQLAGTLLGQLLVSGARKQPSTTRDRLQKCGKVQACPA